MGYNRRSGTGYLSSPGGHASLSDDGSGNVIMALDKQLLSSSSQSDSKPIVSNVDNTTSGFGINNLTPKLFRSGTLALSCSATQINVTHLAPTGLVYGEYEIRHPSATAQQIDLASDTLTLGTTTSRRALINDTASPITLTSTPTITAGSAEGETKFFVNEGADNIVLQDNGTLSGSNLILKTGTARTLATGQAISVQYSTELSMWSEI